MPRFPLAATLIASLFMSPGASAQELTGTLKKIKDSKAVALGYRESSIPFSYVNKAGEPTEGGSRGTALSNEELENQFASLEENSNRLDAPHGVRYVLHSKVNGNPSFINVEGKPQRGKPAHRVDKPRIIDCGSGDSSAGRVIHVGKDRLRNSFGRMKCHTDHMPARLSGR